MEEYYHPPPNPMAQSLEYGSWLIPGRFIILLFGGYGDIIQENVVVLTIIPFSLTDTGFGLLE